ncbi:hypothetical protein CN311_29005 [Mesorhizobium sanjuanii]|uniref:Uncharacterized protein n=1 Tax=Mesorhizobium sanjuanii TaxID=2037900 RepID=A0A2A6F7E6_9HYPH|nr:hypothetical protein [Mesorhizobium sanjuanii]PDQ17635.1 hypothetical protein CN311_29005 [Mesorhizobium sanjuanii]
MPERSEYEIEIKAPAGRSFRAATPAGVFQLRSDQSMMPKSVKRFSDDIMLYLFDLEPDDFRST